MKKYTKLVPFLKIVEECINNKDGYELANLLSIKKVHSPALMSQIEKSNVLKFCKENLPKHWDVTVYSQLRALYAYQNSNVIEACEEQNACVHAFDKLFQDLDRWALPLVYVIHSDLYHLSVLADQELIKQNKKAGNLENLARTLNKVFSYCLNDRRVPDTNSRKWGTYYIANLLFKTYFKLKSTNLCKNIQTAINANNMLKLEEFPISQQVTFHYYSGLILFLNEQYREAEKHLLKAFKYSRGKSEKNILIILHLLIPIRLLSGVIPSNRLLNEYLPIKETYGGLVKSICSGNVKKFESCLKKKEKELIKRNTYLTIEKCKILCMRRLFKKVYNIEGKPTRMFVSSFKHALNFVDIDIEDDEVECLIAVMIEKGYIRGYISHEKRIVVLSASNAFPDINTISLA